MINILDPHVHFIDLRLGNYNWLREGNPPFWQDKSRLVRDVTVKDFAVSHPLNINGVVHIEAGFDNEDPARELNFIQRHCAKHARFQIKAVAYASLLSTPEQLEQQLQELITHNIICGVRYIIDDNLNDVFNYSHIKDNFELLSRHKLSFELQADMTTANSERLIKSVLSQIPDLKIILNHAGFRPLDPNSIEYKRWRNVMRELGKLPNIFTKVSGLEMTKREYSQSDLESSIEECVSMFTDKKVCMASNLPLVLLSADGINPITYQTYWLNAVRAINKLNLPLNLLVHDNAAAFYQFK